MTAKQTIQSGKAILGIEFGSTRIKAIKSVMTQADEPALEALASAVMA